MEAMMDFDLISLLLIITVILLAIFYLKFWSNRRINRSEENELKEIPGWSPKESEEKLASIQQFHPFLAELHKQHGPAAAFWMAGKQCISLASPALFKQNSTPCDRPEEFIAQFKSLVGPSSLALLCGDAARQRRHCFDRHMSHEGVTKYFDMLQQVANDLAEFLRTIPEGQHVPGGETLMAASLSAILQAVFGPGQLDKEGISTFYKNYNVVWEELDQIGGQRTESNSEEQRQFDRSEQYLKSTIKTIIETKKQAISSEEESIVDTLIEKGLSDEELVSETLNTIISGFHTTGRFLLWCLYHLCENPLVEEKLHEEIQKELGGQELTAEKIPQLVYLKQVIDESLRCSKVLASLGRVQPGDRVVGGHMIKAGTVVYYATGVVMDDPAYFSNPLKYNPERFSPEGTKQLPKYAFEPFGFLGGRKCIGYRFANLEASVFLCTLISKFKFSLVEGQVVTPVYGVVTKPKEEIWFTVEERYAKIN